MTYEATCQRLRIGGSISGSTLSGGTVLETHGRNLLAWDGLLGYSGKRGSNIPLLGLDGSRHLPNKPYRERLMTLAVVGYDRDDDGLITLDGRMEHLEDNIDLILDLFTGADDEQVILERTTHLGNPSSGEDGEATRWIKVEAIDPAVFARGPVFGTPHSSYAITMPVVASYPFWQSEAQLTTVISGSGMLINGGTARDSSAVITFSADGTLTNTDTGHVLEVDGASQPLEVDLAARSVVHDPAGTPERGDRYLIPSNREWMRFRRGENALTSDVSVTILHRHQFQT